MVNTHIISISVSVILLIVVYVYLQSRFSLLSMTETSCGMDPTCKSEFDLTVSGIPTKVGTCEDMVSCRKLEKSASSFDIDQMSETMKFNFPMLDSLADIGCMNFKSPEGNDYKLCCKGNLVTCVATQLALYNMFRIHSGFSFAFSSSLCKALPSCFVENDSSPYILFPIPDFSVNIWGDNSNLSCPIDVENSGINKGIAAAFGTLGATPLSNHQAVLYVMKLPRYDTLKYFSFIPYLFQTGRYPNTYPQDTPFGSITDSFHIYDLVNSDNSLVQKWVKGDIDSLEMVVFCTHNKTIANKIFTTFDKISELIPDEFKDYSVVKQIEEMPIVCLPLPAGSKYGDSYDPKGDLMLKEGTLNPSIDKDTLLYDPERDTIGIIARFVPEESKQDEFDVWKDELNSQQNIVVLGLEENDAESQPCCKSNKCSYVPFKLEDQNGIFEDGMWKGGKYRNSKYFNRSSWKIQYPYEGSDDEEDKLNDYVQDIIIGMKESGYDEVREVNINSDPSPFFQYNDMGGKLWSQSGVDMMQFNIGTYGDCRDTVYPTSDVFCLGPYDVAVIVSINYMKNGSVHYNNLNIYDQNTQTSLGSLRGDSFGDIYAYAVSRSDLTCKENLPDTISDFSFIRTGSHTNLAAKPTSGFFVQSRCYLNISEESPFYTSPSMESVPDYKVLVFSPCSIPNRNPAYCNDIDSGECTKNDNITDICPNDLKKADIADGEKTDKITEALCGTLRLNKTADKDFLLVLRYVTIAVLLVSLGFLVTSSIKNNRDGGSIQYSQTLQELSPWLYPTIALIVIVILINITWSTLDKQTAYNYNIAVDQR